MGGRRARRQELPQDPAAVVRALRVCRNAMIEVQAHVRPFGAVYRLASSITTAIDALADHLTDVDQYFGAGCSKASPERLAADAKMRAREAGEIPWER